MKVLGVGEHVWNLFENLFETSTSLSNAFLADNNDWYDPPAIQEYFSDCVLIGHFCLVTSGVVTSRRVVQDNHYLTVALSQGDSDLPRDTCLRLTKGAQLYIW